MLLKCSSPFRQHPVSVILLPITAFDVLLISPFRYIKIFVTSMIFFVSYFSRTGWVLINFFYVGESLLFANKKNA